MDLRGAAATDRRARGRSKRWWDFGQPYPRSVPQQSCCGVLPGCCRREVRSLTAPSSMTNIPTSKIIKPVAEIRDRLLLTIDFIERMQDFPTGHVVRSLICDAAVQGDLRRLRLLAREIDGMLSGLSLHERDGLDTVLHERLGVDTAAEQSRLVRDVAKLIQRGVVRSERERQRIATYVERLEALGDPAQQLEDLRQLL